MKKEFTPIKDYYFIGDLHTCALVSKNASIDWMCVPKFDSPSLFGRLLDLKAGHFCINHDGFEIETRYKENTAIVEHHFKSPETEFILKDFMLPIETDEVKKQFLIRKFAGRKKENNIKVIFSPKTNYGKDIPSIKRVENDLEFETNSQKITLHFPKDAEVNSDDNHYTISFTLNKNDVKYLVLEIYNKNESATFKRESELEKQTSEFWEKWVDTGEYFEYQNKLLVRSMITLKLLQCHPNGSLVAAATTSLPSQIGGVRNWDYRYTWIRDATFTLFAFHVLNCKEEQYRFFDYLYKIEKKHELDDLEINTLYTIDGNEVEPEKILDHLSGYKNSKPVRVGNDATDQFQIDIYGVLIDAHYFMMKEIYETERINEELILRIGEKICQRWKEKDHGIWEIRRSKKNYTYSKVMCWVGLDRIIRIRDKFNLNDKRVKSFEKTRDEIKNWIWENCFVKEKKIFDQYPGAGYQDATNFLMVLVQFLDKKDPLTKEIIQNTCNELCEDEIWVHRYKIHDGLEGRDNPFILCSFWMISAWAILEEVEKAENLLNKFLEYIPESGLISEQINPSTKEFLGNFPQAYSHLGLTMSAYYIHRYKNKKREKQPEKVL